MEIFLLAFGLSMDSAAVSIANGAKNPNLRVLQACKIALFFAFFQILMPLIGFFLGLSFAKFVAQIDHFITFIILFILGAKMIKEGFSKRDEDYKILTLTNRELVLASIATSIDALAVGVTFAFAETKIVLVLGVIFVTCFLCCFFACYIGKKLGALLENRALILGGVVLILIGTKILLEHLGILSF